MKTPYIILATILNINFVRCWPNMNHIWFVIKDSCLAGGECHLHTPFWASPHYRVHRSQLPFIGGINPRFNSLLVFLIYNTHMRIPPLSAASKGCTHYFPRRDIGQTAVLCSCSQWRGLQHAPCVFPVSAYLNHMKSPQIFRFEAIPPQTFCYSPNICLYHKQSGFCRSLLQQSYSPGQSQPVRKKDPDNTSGSFVLASTYFPGPSPAKYFQHWWA